ncbi:glycerol-3-phosphate dehydrogenase [Enterovirga aerilata]|uniref:Glycerol-3-phosphate dehydrogenase n=1 Tax=Enterovirga aerilata TaxID=2730920 RepID=A0A849IC07_9HYPH|nr:glycerol-3-phosphate dehydrogenase [Enterovirga sp. DB1703]
MSEAAPQPPYDLAIIGGGVNGCGIARDAAGRGARVVLFEADDLGRGTSSASTKLIHGGLRYLEYYEFRLVREALQERDVLWRIAPHIVWPLRFVLPHRRGMRPAWLLRAGLFLYDHIGGSSLPKTRALDLRRDPAGEPLQRGLVRAFEYSDCWVEDARLVVLNARDAADRGASIHTRTRVTAAERAGGAWRVRAERQGGGAVEVRAKALVDASGAWIGRVTGTQGGTRPVRLVKGSHIVVPQLFTHDRPYIFQNADRRIVFAIPYERDFTLIGTTDIDYAGEPAEAAASPEEIAYLCEAVNAYFARRIGPEDVVWTYAGVRSLYDDGASSAQEATRDYVLDLDETEGVPLLSVFGGKITTYRRLAEAAITRLKDHLPAAGKPAWTGDAPLPGGDFPKEAFEPEVASLRARHPFLDPALARRLVRAYGTRAERILAGARREADLGRVFGSNLTEREVLYLMDQEWAETAQDVLWRRSKLGLRLTPAQAAGLDAFMRTRLPHLAAAE